MCLHRTQNNLKVYNANFKFYLNKAATLHIVSLQFTKQGRYDLNHDHNFLLVSRRFQSQLSRVCDEKIESTVLTLVMSNQICYEYPTKLAMTLITKDTKYLQINKQQTTYPRACYQVSTCEHFMKMLVQEKCLKCLSLQLFHTLRHAFSQKCQVNYVFRCLLVKGWNVDRFSLLLLRSHRLCRRKWNEIRRNSPKFEIF